MRVYLSSTLNDLEPEREAVRKALSGDCVVVESYTADERSVRKCCQEDVAGCDLYIGIIGRRYGLELSHSDGQFFTKPKAPHSVKKGLSQFDFFHCVFFQNCLGINILTPNVCVLSYTKTLSR